MHYIRANTMLKIKQKFIEELMILEGGDTYTNDPNDSGGGTKWGVTEKLARDCEYYGHMRELTYDKAIEILNKVFWEPMKLDYILQYGLNDLAFELLECSYNCGVHRTTVFLQKTINALVRPIKQHEEPLSLKVDGVFGKGTLSALGIIVYYTKYRYGKETSSSTVKSYDKLITSMCNSQQGAFYIDLTEKRQKDKRYVRGWFKHRIMVRKEQ